MQEDFPQRLKRIMRAASCRPADLALLLDVPHATLDRWLSARDFIPKRRRAVERRALIERKLSRIGEAVDKQLLPVDQSLPLADIKEALYRVRAEYVNT